MKKLLVLFMVIVSVSATKAGDYLTFQTSDGQTQSVEIGGGLTLALDGSTLTVGNVSFTLADLDKMFFTECVSVGDSGWVTYSSTKNLDYAAGGLTAYSAQFDDNAGTVSLTELSEAVPGGEGVVISGASGDYYVPVATAATELTDNSLLGTCSTAVTADGLNYYVLAKTDDLHVGFCRLESDQMIPANKAYYVASSGNQTRYLITQETTDIEKVATATDEGDDTIYDLQGRRVDNPRRGIYIKNGKKVVIK